MTTAVAEEKKKPDTMAFGDVRDLALDWGMTHQVLEFRDTGAEPGDKVFFGLPYRDIGVVASAVGIPAAFARRVEPGLLKRNLDYMAKEKGLVDQAQAVVANGEVVQVVWNRGAELIPPVTVLEHVMRAVGDGAVVGRHTLWPDNATGAFWVEVIFQDDARTHRADALDLLNSGITIEHHIGGGEATSIDAFIYRQVCTNGLIARERGAPWKIAHRELEKALPSRLQYLAGYSDDAAKRLIGSKTAPVDDPVASAVGLAKNLKTPKKARDAFMALVAMRRPNNWYDLIQCLTEAANGVPLPLYRKVVTSAGALVTSFPRMCGSCHQVVQ